jgi:hypothetical protein
VGAYRKNQHQHMFALAPSEEIRYDTHGKTFTFKRDPPSIQPVLLVFTNEMLHGQEEGFPMRDFSKPPTSPDHFFFLKVILLFFMGDYPGQGKAANMLHTGKRACHWCHHLFETHSPGHNVALGTRQHLPEEHPVRSDETYGPQEEREPPATRTHADTCERGKDIEQMDEAPKTAAQKDSGVYGFCVLAFLAMFNVIWDITGDMMHIIKGMWMRRLMPMLKGELVQAAPKKPNMTHTVAGEQVPYPPRERERRKRTYEQASQEWTKVHQVYHHDHSFSHDMPIKPRNLSLLMVCKRLYVFLPLYIHPRARKDTIFATTQIDYHVTRTPLGLHLHTPLHSN